MMPAPILFSALYAVGTEFMEEKHRRFFMVDGDQSTNWAEDAFRVVYNTYFQDEDYYISGSEDVLDARLRPLIQTMELVGDDELELNWAEFIEFQTGYPLRSPKAEVLSFKIGRAMPTGTGVFHNDCLHHHFGKTFMHSVQRNRLLQQGGVILGIVGNWSHPLLDGNGVSTPTVNKMNNRYDWYIKPMDDAAGDDRGDITSTQDSINLFYGGEIYVPDGVDLTDTFTVSAGDVDPRAMGDTDDEGDITESSSDDSTTESTDLEFYADPWAGMSFLSGIDFT